MTVKATQFRQNLFQLLDRCRTGEKITIERGGELFELIPKRRRMKIDELPENPGALAEPDAVHLVKAWEWKPDDVS